MIPVRAPKVITRHRDGLIHAYVPDSGALGALEPVAVFRPRSGDTVVASAVSPDLERVVYTTLNGVVCLTRAGDLVWASDFEPHSEQSRGHRPGCALSLDGRTVWVYRPDAVAERGDADQWVVHDAESGAVLARRDLETVGHGADHHVHPEDGSVYLDIGEGQDGSVILRGTVGADGEDQDEEEWFRYYLIDVRTGTLSGEMAVEVTNPYELVPLGDGSWLTDGSDGNPIRWSSRSGRELNQQAL
jgi:hypothetical protein